MTALRTYRTVHAPAPERIVDQSEKYPRSKQKCLRARLFRREHQPELLPEMPSANNHRRRLNNPGMRQAGTRVQDLGTAIKTFLRI